MFGRFHRAEARGTPGSALRPAMLRQAGKPHGAYVKVANAPGDDALLRVSFGQVLSIDMASGVVRVRPASEDGHRGVLVEVEPRPDDGLVVEAHLGVDVQCGRDTGGHSSKRFGGNNPNWGHRDPSAGFRPSRNATLSWAPDWTPLFIRTELDGFVKRH